MAKQVLSQVGGGGINRTIDIWKKQSQGYCQRHQPSTCLKVSKVQMLPGGVAKPKETGGGWDEEEIVAKGRRKEVIEKRG